MLGRQRLCAVTSEASASFAGVAAFSCELSGAFVVSCVAVVLFAVAAVILCIAPVRPSATTVYRVPKTRLPPPPPPPLLALPRASKGISLK